MKPSDIIHDKAQKMIKKDIETGFSSQYQPGYADKLISAILQYLDEQSHDKQ